MATVTSATGRAAAILTTGEVFGTALDMANTVDGRVTVDRDVLDVRVRVPVPAVSHIGEHRRRNAAVLK